MGRLELAHTLIPLHPREVDVHQHHVRQHLRNLLQRRLRIGIATHQLVTRRALNQRRQARQNALIIIYNGNFDLHKYGK